MVWETKLQWDDPITDTIFREWNLAKNCIQDINQCRVPRWLHTKENQEIELHGFCDASTKAYACVVYCKTTGQSPTIVLVAAKTKLAPISKKLSLPRLELSGALLLSKLILKLKQCLNYYEIKTYCWVDSQVVLGWLNGEAEKWKPFVANRVKTITNSVPSECWRYVKSKENPADCASRGITTSELKEHSLWWHGPGWLKTHEYQEQNQNHSYTTNEEKRTAKQRPIIKLSVLPVHETKEDSSISNTKQSQINLKTNEDSPKTNKIKTKQIKFSNLCLSLLYLFITIIPTSSASFKITPIQNNSIYFDKLADMKLIRDEWKIISYYDMNPYWQGTTACNDYIKYLDRLCIKIKGDSHCDVISIQLQLEYSELEYNNHLLLSQHSGTRQDKRRRRGLINGVGYIANSLFGVLDDHFAEQYKQDIQLTRDNENHLALLLKNQTSVLEVEYNILKRNEESLNKQHKMHNQLSMNLENLENFLKSESAKNALINEFNLGAIAVSNMLRQLETMQTTLLNTVIDVYHGRFNFHLINPDQLRNTLSTISSH
ncbi:unnamed protein product, partial [Brenthis ino]